jgi:hypothetical protein
MNKLSERFNFGVVTEEKVKHILAMFDADNNQMLSLEEITPLIITYMKEVRLKSKEEKKKRKLEEEMKENNRKE